jgi:hypothetical protein
MTSRTDGSTARGLAALTIAAALLIAVGVTLALTGSHGPLGSVKAYAYGTTTPPKPPTTVPGCRQQFGESAQGDQCVAGILRTAALKRCAKKPARARAACKRSAKSAYTKHLAQLTACSTQELTAIGKLNETSPEYATQAQAIVAAERACKAKVK